MHFNIMNAPLTSQLSPLSLTASQKMNLSIAAESDQIELNHLLETGAEQHERESTALEDKVEQLQHISDSLQTDSLSVESYQFIAANAYQVSKGTDINAARDILGIDSSGPQLSTENGTNVVNVDSSKSKGTLQKVIDVAKEKGKQIFTWLREMLMKVIKAGKSNEDRAKSIVTDLKQLKENGTDFNKSEKIRLNEAQVKWINKNSVQGYIKLRERIAQVDIQKYSSTMVFLNEGLEKAVKIIGEGDTQGIKQLKEDVLNKTKETVVSQLDLKKGSDGVYELELSPYSKFSLTEKDDGSFSFEIKKREVPESDLEFSPLSYNDMISICNGIETSYKEIEKMSNEMSTITSIVDKIMKGAFFLDRSEAAQAVKNDALALVNSVANLASKTISSAVQAVTSSNTAYLRYCELSVQAYEDNSKEKKSDTGTNVAKA